MSYYWFYNFPNQFIWFSVWICIAHFLFHMFSLFWLAVAWIRKDVSTKWKNKFISSKWIVGYSSIWEEGVFLVVVGLATTLEDKMALSSWSTAQATTKCSSELQINVQINGHSWNLFSLALRILLLMVKIWFWI